MLRACRHHRRGGIVLVEDFRVRNHSYSQIERSPFESLQATDYYGSHQERGGHWNQILQSNQSLTASETRVDANTDINISGSREVFSQNHAGGMCDCDDQERIHWSSGNSSGHDDIEIGESMTIMDYITSF